LSPPLISLSASHLSLRFLTSGRRRHLAADHLSFVFRSVIGDPSSTPAAADPGPDEAATWTQRELVETWFGRRLEMRLGRRRDLEQQQE
ncbi:hypothetical protein LINPERPRIM_LOCUS27696, partial [Linum perenne]